MKGGELVQDFEQSYREYERMVHAFLLRLCAYRDALRDGDREAMTQLLREGREIKESLEN